MELDAGERLVLLHILPKEGDLTTLRIVRDLQAALSFTEEEHKLYDFRMVDGNTHWSNPEVKVEVPIGKKAMEIIRAAIKDLDAKKKLNLAFLPVCERFLEDEE